MDQRERCERRDQARHRAERQRRAVLVGTGAVALVLAVVLGVSSLSGGEKGYTEEAAPAPPELPRGGRSIFPESRVVGFYGTPEDEELGVLGIGSPESVAGKLERQARPYAEVARARPTLPAFELIAVVANASAGDDGKFRTRLEPATIRRYLAAARRARALLLLDIQPGRSNFPEEMAALEGFLAQPDVSLALDPEWHMGDNEVPGEAIGSMTADEVNAVSARLSEIVRRRRLPEKMLVVHQFTRDMVEGRERLRRYPGVELVLNVDGFGDRRLKVDKYNEFVSGRGRARHGFKLFYREDTKLMGPRDVLSLRPPPEFVVYE